TGHGRGLCESRVIFSGDLWSDSEGTAKKRKAIRPEPPRDLVRRTAMRVAYLTLDEVHQDLAMRLAENAGMIRYPLSPRDPPPDGQFDAVLYDWDYLLPEQKQAIFSQLCSGRSSFPVVLPS